MNYLEIAANATTVVKASPGRLQSIIVNNAGTSWNIRVLDGTVAAGAVASGAVAIAGNTKFAVPAAGITLPYNCDFSKGLVIVTSDGANAGSITVTWY